MSYSRKQIQNIIARNKPQRISQKSPKSPNLSPKTSQILRELSPKEVTHRYKQLHTKYQQLLEEAKDKNHKFKMQQKQLQSLRRDKAKDQEQINKLRAMLGFVKKQDKSVQVHMDMQSGGSWSTKIQKDTTVDYQQEFDVSTPVKNNRNYQVNKTTSSKGYDFNCTLTGFKTVMNLQQKYGTSHIPKTKTETNISMKNNQKFDDPLYSPKYGQKIQLRQSKLSNSPYSKLRFSKKI